MNTTRHELIKKHIDSFPVLPVTVMRLMTVTSNPASSAQEVIDVILTDQSLCLTVLKISNSVLFGRPHKVDSIDKAVSILGFDEVQRIALAKALINSFSKVARQHKVSIDKFWDHSFVCGMAARLMAQSLNISPDIAFMGGLIHDIGKLIMLETFADDYALDWMLSFSSKQLRDDELHTFSFTHDRVGGHLLQKWLFPKNLIAAVEAHHCPCKVTAEQDMAAVIQLADILSFLCCNQPLLGKDDLMAAIHHSLPELQTAWHSCGLSWERDAIHEWFTWLVNHHAQGCTLKDAFSS